MAETPPIESTCETFLPGHCVHWIQGKKSCELGQSEVAVSTIVVHDDGLVDIEGKDLKLTLWNHSPGRLRSALSSYRRRVVRKPRVHVLTVRGYSNGLFNMARSEEQETVQTTCAAPAGGAP